ncbi:MAG TPA: TonB family protein, partial [Cyclobacteriaceae bacterium]
MRNILILLLLIASSIANAQVRMKLNYSKDWRLATPDSAVFIRVCFYDTLNHFFTGPVADLYVNGKPQMKGTYRFKKKEGEFASYYENGNTESTGMFENNMRVGVWKTYDADGKLKSEVKFVPGTAQQKVITFNDPSGVKFEVTERFEAESFLDPSTYPSLRITAPGKAYVIEKEPEPDGGLARFMYAVAKNIKYPPAARQNHIEGTVFVGFVVQKDGSLSEVKIVRSVGGGCDEVAINALILANKKIKWKPGTRNGEPVA